MHQLLVRLMPHASASSEPHANVSAALCQRHHCHSHVFAIQKRRDAHACEGGSCRETTAHSAAQALLQCCDDMALRLPMSGSTRLSRVLSQASRVNMLRSSCCSGVLLCCGKWQAVGGAASAPTSLHYPRAPI
jgi:hypothetical protein